MKKNLSELEHAGPRRLSLEQKIMRMIHRYRVAEKRRKRHVSTHFKRLNFVVL